MALSLLRSYLTDGCQVISINGDFSIHSKFGVLQGSAFGPLILFLATFLLPLDICKNGISFHSYAEETQ